MRRLIKFLHTLGAIGMIAAMVHGEWASLWVLLAIALINVALGVWRPRFSRRQQ